jgi:ABC-type transporter Mla MlaB component
MTRLRPAVAETLVLPEQLRHEEASGWISRLESAIAEHQRARTGAPARIDCAALDRFDSSAVVVLLAAMRCAEGAGVKLELANLPQKLMKLASLYGADRLLLNAVV